MIHPCPLTSGLLRQRLSESALAAGSLPHLATCTHCRSALERAAALDAPAGVPPAALPTAAQIYRRAQLRRRREVVSATLRKAEGVARLGWSIGFATAIGTLSFGLLLTAAGAFRLGAGPGLLGLVVAAGAGALLLGCAWALREA